MGNILVTGGAGYIGIHTCLALIEKGAQLSVQDHGGGFKNPKLAKAPLKRLYRHKGFPSLKTLSLFRLPVVPYNLELPDSLAREYNTHKQDMKFLKQHLNKTSLQVFIAVV